MIQYIRRILIKGVLSMAKKYNKQKVKLTRNAIIILAVALVVVVSVIVFTNLPTEKKKINDTYSSLSTTHVFDKISYSEFKKKMNNKEEFILFYGKKDCEACQARINDLNSTAQTLNVKVIYYLDANSLSDTQKSELYNTYGVKKNFTPQLLSFKEGAKVLGTYEDMFGKAYNEELDTATNFKISVAHVLNSIN